MCEEEEREKKRLEWGLRWILGHRRRRDKRLCGPDRTRRKRRKRRYITRRKKPKEHCMEDSVYLHTGLKKIQDLKKRREEETRWKRSRWRKHGEKNTKDRQKPRQRLRPYNYLSRHTYTILWHPHIWYSDTFQRTLPYKYTHSSVSQFLTPSSLYTVHCSDGSVSAHPWFSQRHN